MFSVIILAEYRWYETLTMRAFQNRRFLLLLLAILIVVASIYFTNSLASRLALEEDKRVELLLQAIKSNSTTSCPDENGFALGVVTSNKTIPLIMTDEEGQIQNHINIDTSNVKNPKQFIQEKLSEFKNLHQTLVLDYGFGKSLVYYGESSLLRQLRYFPYVQMAIILLLAIVSYIALQASQKSLQNQVWVGLSKETAHQLGTPLSSLEGWLALLEDGQSHPEAVDDMKKDMARLKLVADRFAKIGNTPELVEENLVARLENMVTYMQKRSPAKVSISLKTSSPEIMVNLNGPLFDWVVENLIRNALDALEGKGTIDIIAEDSLSTVKIDIIDSGKGIAQRDINRVFKPGFSTKKRGWGLGLSLAKRIVEQYHHGSIFVKNSEVGVGTRFRILFRR